MASGVGVRVATADDIEFLADVVLEANESRLAVEAGWDRDAFRCGLIDDAAEQVRGEALGSTTYVIEDEGEPVGRLRLVLTRQRIEIAGLQILPAAQNHGLGSSIITRVLAEAAERRLPVELDVEHDNPDARRLYVRLGFQPIPSPLEDDELDEPRPSDQERMIVVVDSHG